MTFRTKSGALWRVDEWQLGQWRKVYGRLDVWAEVAKAALWVEAHPSRRKTAKGMNGFLIRWLNRADKDRTSAPVVNGRDGAGEPWHYAHCPHAPKCGDYRSCCELSRGLFS